MKSPKYHVRRASDDENRAFAGEAGWAHNIFKRASEALINNVK